MNDQADTNIQTDSAASGDPLQVIPVDEAPHFTGSAEQFTGTVEVGPLFLADLEGHNGGALVRFEPGARTAWHTHPRGQTLVVTDGGGVGPGRGWRTPHDPPRRRRAHPARHPSLARRDG